MDFSRLRDKAVLVLGDVIIDYYRTVRATRISPEREILIFEPQSESMLPGGAANVANNLISMGLGRVLLASVVGDIPQGFSFPGENLLVNSPDKQTTIKERIVTRQQQVIRIDHQSGFPITECASAILSEKIMPLLKGTDCIVMSDYAHGVMRSDMVLPIMDMAKKLGIPTVVDSKSRDTLTKYCGCTIALPNHIEARKFYPTESFEDDMELAKRLLNDMDGDAIGLTAGKKGIVFSCQDWCRVFPPMETNTEEEVIDVTGAGDTVTAAVAAGKCLGMPYDQILEVANVAAGIVVRKKGVATASSIEIENARRNTCLNKETKS